MWLSSGASSVREEVGSESLDFTANALLKTLGVSRFPKVVSETRSSGAQGGARCSGYCWSDAHKRERLISTVPYTAPPLSSNFNFHLDPCVLLQSPGALR